MTDGDVLPGDIFVTHPTYGPITNAVVSTLVVLSVNRSKFGPDRKVKFELDLAEDGALDIWHRARELYHES